MSEALTIVARHPGATEARVIGRVLGERLLLTVTDNGIGGADVGSGTGLAGLVTRLEELDGPLAVSSPSGGPTEIRMESPVPDRHLRIVLAEDAALLREGLVGPLRLLICRRHR